MLESEVKDYLDAFKTDVLLRLGAVEREASETRRNQLCEDDMKRVFAEASGRMNYITRISVAIIAAFALIGNSLTMVLGNHYTLQAEVCCARTTDRKLAAFEEHQRDLNKLLVREGAQEFWHELNLQGFIVKGTKP